MIFGTSQNTASSRPPGSTGTTLSTCVPTSAISRRVRTVARLRQMPDCGTGLIRQSEHRNVNSEDILYSENLDKRLSFLAGVDFRREAPSALDLDRADDAGRFYPMTANNLVMNFSSL